MLDLAVVQSIVRQTATGSQTIGQYVDGLDARVQGLALTHDLIADDDWRGVTMHDLAERQLAPFVKTPSQVQYAGPAVSLTPVAAQNIGLALHELAVNAARFGALSGAGGTIALAWTLEQSRLHVSWRERGQVPVDQPSRRGFGRVVLERITPEALDGRAALSFDREGINWNLEIPAVHLL